MGKPILGLILGAILGIFDGLTAWVSAPSLRPEIAGIVAGSTFKGLLAGVLIGWWAKKGNSVASCVLFGLAVGATLATIIAIMPASDGNHYYFEIILPGSVLGMIVGFATAKYGRGAAGGRKA